ncbi:hypothetical protein J2W55_002804 [Mucilaginibacter pocheonensis]|uniref:Transposase IS110-like N-terminal domain-containing protein n=1 Tax=Mucilaginibacter pocheonensis TaxID=398050 RepID=A0ABU1TC36_9SPHI|nr:ISAs1 family transposase [Mucilaginibacter pocheonensis]MDR6942951.1 hypothetical protein [Mucilaginibacter pocheonensis]
MLSFEHTWLYLLPLAIYLEDRQIPFSMINALQIKRSLGLVRGKNDKVDAKRIAEYACLYREKLALTKMPSREMMQLQPLLALRDHLLRQRAGMEATQHEQARFLSKTHSIDQKAIAEQIIESKGDYILALKQNQETLYDQVINQFHFKEDSYSQHLDKGHGRAEIRTCKVIHQLNWIDERENWSGMKSIIKITSERIIGDSQPCKTAIIFPAFRPMRLILTRLSGLIGESRTSCTGNWMSVLAKTIIQHATNRRHKTWPWSER